VGSAKPAESEAAMPPIDLRSDTVTRPTSGMRAAMAAAEVGDDQYAEDPTVNGLQERVADLLGKEAALWVPTGTMANHVALRVFTRPGDEVVIAREAHALWHEAGAAAAAAGVQLTEVGAGGVFSAADFLAVLKPRDHFLYPPTTLVEVEDTHNRAGGVVFPPALARGICEAARAVGVPSYLDGARLFNAAIVDGVGVRDRAAPFDLVSIALSKGLGAPAGSVLAGSRAVIEAAVRWRRIAGGAMRQVGILAAAGLYALDHHVERLAQDHANARALAEVLGTSRRVLLDPATVRTNIVMLRLTEHGPDAPTVVARARAAGVLVNALGPRTLRAVTHLDVSAADCDRAGSILVRAM
jgi:threonine aldolase